jgi:hypothetical protein
VISIAIGLVTLIAQREGAGTDVRLYYHEALAFEVVASSIALLLVLSVQLVWPLQFALHHLGEGTQLQLFKLILLGVHLGWLAVNLSALAYFVATTFRFVQQSAREQLRERYIANHVLPVEITARLREQLYHSAPSDLLGPAADPDHKPDRTVLYLGIDFDGSEEVEIERTFKRPFALYDVHMILLRWALRRWLRRCDDEQGGEQKKRGLGLNEPFLMFPIFLDRAMTGTVAWCLRRGGVPLDWVERVALRAAFRFRTVPDEK